MVHQLKRLQSPCVLITNHDASSMPNIRLPGAGGGEAVLKFDRILCDVPCTGDGTMRKNLDIWAKWNTANGNNLHGYLRSNCSLPSLRLSSQTVLADSLWLWPNKHPFLMCYQLGVVLKWNSLSFVQDYQSFSFVVVENKMKYWIKLLLDLFENEEQCMVQRSTVKLLSDTL